MYDITVQKSFDNLKEWLREVRQNSDPEIVIFVVGNQVDLADDEREVETVDAENWVRENHLDGFCEASAKTAENVSDVREYLGLLLELLKFCI
jgi:GTPase SAR1 family protein